MMSYQQNRSADTHTDAQITGKKRRAEEGSHKQSDKKLHDNMSYDFRGQGTETLDICWV